MVAVTEQEKQLANNPAHYTSRSVQCIEFTKHLDFNLGNAFKYIWRSGLKDSLGLELEKIHFYIRTALIEQPSFLGAKNHGKLLRMLSIMYHEFDPSQYDLLQALLDAANGDYESLRAYAFTNEVFHPETTSFLMGA